jgi:hypothetical protein
MKQTKKSSAPMETNIRNSSQKIKKKLSLPFSPLPGYSASWVITFQPNTAMPCFHPFCHV